MLSSPFNSLSVQQMLPDVLFPPCLKLVLCSIFSLHVLQWCKMMELNVLPHIAGLHQGNIVYRSVGFIYISNAAGACDESETSSMHVFHWIRHIQLSIWSLSPKQFHKYLNIQYMQCAAGVKGQCQCQTHERCRVGQPFVPPVRGCKNAS